ncbi:MAG: TonB-dependent receptor [Bradymonadales bacterium]|nr:TonB-dependent receptor [Bradymonadales bacterium]
MTRPTLEAFVATVLMLAGITAVKAQDQPALPAGLSALPEVVQFIQAPYPAEALEDAVQADVLVEIVIDENGVVTGASPVSLVLYTFDDSGQLLEQTLLPESDPYGFVPEAIEALLQFQFHPALDEADQPVAVSIVWRYGFYFEEQVVIEEIEPADGQDIDRAVNLVGTVMERGTDHALVAQEVTATRDTELFRATTDENGMFEFRDLAPGSWLIEIRPAEFQGVRSLEEVVEGERTVVTYRLERQSYGEYSYEVREEAVRREVSRQTISVVEINRIPGNSGDAIKVVQNLPGVARAPFGSGLIVIRGSAPGDSDIQVDGIEIPLAFHFGGLNAVINSDLLANLEFIPGAFTTEYGRATGGIVNIQTREPRTDGYHGYLDVDVFDTSVLVEGPIADGWSFFAAGRRSYIDAILPAVFPDDAGLSLTVAPRYWDYQAKLRYEPNLSHNLSLFLYGSDDTLEFLVEEPFDFPLARGNADAGLGFHRATLQWVGELSERITNRLVFGGGYQFITSSAGEDLRFDLEVGPLFQARNTLEIRPIEGLRIRPGLDISWSLASVSFRSPRFPGEGEALADTSTSSLITLEVENQVTYQPGAFLEVEWDLLDRLTLVPGLRLDYYRPPEAWSVDGRLAARYNPAEDWTIKGAIGSFHQPPLPQETAEIFGNPQLDPESAIHYVIGAEYRITDYLNVDLQLFYKDLNDLIVDSNAFVERDGELVNEVFNNNGEGRVYGAELLVRHQMANNFFGWLSYTLSFSQRRDAPDQEYRTFAFDQTHILALIGSYDLGRGWSVGGRFRWVTGLPDTPVVGSVYDADSDRYVPVYGELNSIRNGAFHQLDLRVDKRFTFERWVLDLYLDVQNVYNQGNQEGTAYNYDYSRSAPLTGLPIIPSFGVRGSF